MKVEPAAAAKNGKPEKSTLKETPKVPGIGQAVHWGFCVLILTPGDLRHPSFQNVFHLPSISTIEVRME